jgi:hypothetical protein
MKSSIFLDKPGDSFVPSRIIAEVIEIGGDLSKVLPESISTPPTQRIGNKVEKIELQEKTYEETGVGGVKLNSVTVFLSDDIPEEGIDISDFDGFRVGKNIKTYSHFSAPMIRPVIRLCSEKFLEESSSEYIDHEFKMTTFGIGTYYKTVDEYDNYIPYRDFSQLNPVNFLKNSSGISYPFVYNSAMINDNIEHYVDPSHPGADGSIDVLNVREYALTFSPSDIQIMGAKGNMQGGGIEQSHAGSSIIDNVYKLDKKENDHFYDSSDNDFDVVLKPGIIDDMKSCILPFNEDIDVLNSSYSFWEKGFRDNLLSGSIKTFSEIGTRFKSATNGLIFGESNALGTDSIAFGGLRK